MNARRDLVPVRRQGVRQQPLTLDATYTVLPNPPQWQNEFDPFRLPDSVPPGPSIAPGRRPTRKRSFMEAVDDFIDRREGDLAFAAVVIIALFVVWLLSLFLFWVLPLAVMGVAVAFVAALSTRPWVPCVWAATVAVLSVIAAEPGSISHFLHRFDELLCDWTTYKTIARVALAVIISVTIVWMLPDPPKTSTAEKNADAQKADAPDPRGYGRYATDDFIERGTYGDAQLASKGELHLALSRTGNENLRFTPKFYE